MNKFAGEIALIKIRWLIVAMLSLLLCLSSCTDEAQPPKPPLNLPFAVQKAGTKVETELWIVEHRNYLFRLRFLFKDQEDRKRVKKLVGDDIQNKDGDPGVPTPLRLTINVIDASGERPLLEQEISELRLKSWGMDNFDKRIANVVLKPGHYRVRIESLKDAPEFDGTFVRFVIGYDPKSTPIKE